MKKSIRVGLIVLAIAIIMAELILLGYSNWTWSENWGSYLVILGMICSIGSMTLSIRQDKNNKLTARQNH